ncbi:MAG TPA: ribbon-helix-helix domain-containing protein [Candidatus Limnocylindria bacterium]|nr:ribbon-helix-helix domain-containing protein [Candidatus Limnocylindria bacterium]
MSLDNDLLRQAKQMAAATGRTLNAVIEDALRQALARSGESGERPPVEITTFRGNGVQPGVDLDDSAALLEVMESGP